EQRISGPPRQTCGTVGYERLRSAPVVLNAMGAWTISADRPRHGRDQVLVHAAGGGGTTGLMPGPTAGPSGNSFSHRSVHVVRTEASLIRGRGPNSPDQHKPGPVDLVYGRRAGPVDCRPGRFPGWSSCVSPVQ